MLYRDFLKPFRQPSENLLPLRPEPYLPGNDVSNNTILFSLGSPYLFDIYTGRIIQLQNLPQNHLPDLEDARDIVKSGDYELMNILYDDTSQTPPL